MTRLRLGLACLFLLCSACQRPAEPRRIAITLDDAPLARPLSYESQWERGVAVDSMATALTSRGIPATLFAIGSDIAQADLSALLNTWAGYGFHVGNHSLTHRSFRGMPREEGIREIAQTQALLSRVVGPERLTRRFRFPFLEEGGTLPERAAWMSILDSLDLRPAPVTITTDDWRFDNEYEEAEKAQEWERRYDVGQAYLQHVKEAVQFWDRQAQEIFGRNVRHVLMLHANRINRDYLGQILDWLSSEGFEFITLEEAYQDPLFQEESRWMGTSGVSILESIKQTRLGEGHYPAP